MFVMFTLQSLDLFCVPGFVFADEQKHFQQRQRTEFGMGKAQAVEAFEADAVEVSERFLSDLSAFRQQSGEFIRFFGRAQKAWRDESAFETGLNRGQTARLAFAVGDELHPGDGAVGKR